MSDIGFGGVDFGFATGELNAELLAYGQTPEGEAAFAEIRQNLGIDPSLPGFTGGATGEATGEATGGGGDATVVDSYFEGSGMDRVRVTVFS